MSAAFADLPDIAFGHLGGTSKAKTASLRYPEVVVRRDHMDVHLVRQAKS
jgi:hypothetical protein